MVPPHVVVEFLDVSEGAQGYTLGSGQLLPLSLCHSLREGCRRTYGCVATVELAPNTR